MEEDDVVSLNDVRYTIAIFSHLHTHTHTVNVNYRQDTLAQKLCS